MDQSSSFTNLMHSIIDTYDTFAIVVAQFSTLPSTAPCDLTFSNSGGGVPPRARHCESVHLSRTRGRKRRRERSAHGHQQIGANVHAGVDVECVCVCLCVFWRALEAGASSSAGRGRGGFGPPSLHQIPILASHQLVLLQ